MTTTLIIVTILALAAVAYLRHLKEDRRLTSEFEAALRRNPPSGRLSQPRHEYLREVDAVLTELAVGLANDNADVRLVVQTLRLLALLRESYPECPGPEILASHRTIT